MTEPIINYDEHPIDRIYVEWANTLDSAGKDSGPARERVSDGVTLSQLFANLEKVVAVGQETDILKKYVFYGKESDQHLPTPLLSTNATIAAGAALADHNTMRVLHAILGLVSEAAEMAEMLHDHIFFGKGLDVPNLIEESGNHCWYLALNAKACGFATFDEFMAGNKAKLTARYGTAWSQDGAITRDTANEMIELRKGVDGTFTLTDGVNETDPIPYGVPDAVVEEAIANLKSTTTRIIKRCPACGHQPHPAHGCYNIQSDGDCECRVNSSQRFTIDGKLGLWDDREQRVD